MVKVWRSGKAEWITPILHSRSRLWTAFHESAPFIRRDILQKELNPHQWAAGNNPQEMMRAFLDMKNIRLGTVLEAGVYRDCVVPNIPGIRTFVLSLDKDEVTKTQINYPYTEAVHSELGNLPFGPVKKESLDVAVWHGGFLNNLEVCLDEFGFPLDQRSRTIKTVKALWSVLKKGGYFIEFYPFDDWRKLPKLLRDQRLEVGGMELIKRAPGKIDLYEIRYVSLRLSNKLMLISTDQYDDLVRTLIREPGEYLQPYLRDVPYSAMIIRK